MKSQKEQVENKNEELLFTAESLKDLNKEKNTIISVTAHDLKAPLNNIEGLVNLVMMEKGKAVIRPTQLPETDAENGKKSPSDDRWHP